MRAHDLIMMKRRVQCGRIACIGAKPGYGGVQVKPVTSVKALRHHKQDKRSQHACVHDQRSVRAHHLQTDTNPRPDETAAAMATNATERANADTKSMHNGALAFCAPSSESKPSTYNISTRSLARSSFRVKFRDADCYEPHAKRPNNGNTFLSVCAPEPDIPARDRRTTMWLSGNRLSERRRGECQYLLWTTASPRNSEPSANKM